MMWLDVGLVWALCIVLCLLYLHRFTRCRHEWIIVKRCAIRGGNDCDVHLCARCGRHRD